MLSYFLNFHVRDYLNITIEEEDLEQVAGN